MMVAASDGWWRLPDGHPQFPVSFSLRASLSVAQPSLCYTVLMKVEEIAEAVANLPPDQLARFRRWFTAFEAGRTNHAEELDSAATKLGRLAGRAFAELKRRAKEP
jgi:hypothetical protein